MTSCSGKPITCKAAVVRQFNKPLTIESVEVQPPGDEEVRVKMVAVGLCHSDLTFMDGYNLDQPLPFIPGHEGSGIVESVGKGVKTVKAGDKVFTLFLPQCNQCENCKDGRSNICDDAGRKEIRPANFLRCFGYDGTPRFSSQGKVIHHLLGCSSFSEYTVIPENSCIKVDPKAPLETACILACGFSTGYGSSANAVKIQPGDITAVWGLGGVGLATVVGCKAKGAGRIIGIDMNPEKETIARKLGCTDFICVNNASKPVNEIITEITNGGVHFAFACIGNIKVMETAVLSTRIGGTAVLVGVTPVKADMKVEPSFILPGRKIIGTVIGDYKIMQDLPKLVQLYLDGILPLQEFITGNYKLNQLNEAVQLMREGKTIRSVILM